jgi:hypothetical protein
MPHVMISKCAEALARRMGWSDKLSGTYIPEEMQQAGLVDVTDKAEVKTVDKGEAKKPAPAAKPQGEEVAQAESEAEPAEVSFEVPIPTDFETLKLFAHQLHLYLADQPGEGEDEGVSVFQKYLAGKGGKSMTLDVLVALPEKWAGWLRDGVERAVLNEDVSGFEFKPFAEEAEDAPSFSGEPDAAAPDVEPGGATA